jgi:hypothetical protein
LPEMDRFLAQWNATDGGLIGHWLQFFTIEA